MYGPKFNSRTQATVQRRADRDRNVKVTGG